MLIKICQFCKKEFEAKKEGAKYCSMSCMANAFKGRKLNKKVKTHREPLSPEPEEQLRLSEVYRSNGLISEEEYQKRKEKLLS